jgi:hypothetical protein
MKKHIFLSAAVVSALILLSCKKDYECSCHTATGAHEHVIIKTTSKKADEECKAKAVGSYTACELE